MREKSALDKIIALMETGNENEISNTFGKLAKLHHLPIPQIIKPTPAAVLIPIVKHIQEPSLILTVRTSHLRHHPGQVSFPGGSLEDCDGDPQTCMLREVNEEIGLLEHQIRILGSLGQWPSNSGYLVTPFIGLIESPLTLTPNKDEVEEIFEVPLSTALNFNCYRKIKLDPSKDQLYFEMIYQNKRIWGFTAAILALLSAYLTQEKFG